MTDHDDHSLPEPDAETWGEEHEDTSWQADEMRAAADPQDLADEGKDLDDEDDMPCGEGMCRCSCIGAGAHPCGCDCPHPDDCECTDCIPDEDYYQDDDAEEWQPGTCDNCYGSTEEDLERAAKGPGLIPVCACAIGEGAPLGECRCGPPTAEEVAALTAAGHALEEVEPS